MNNQESLTTTVVINRAHSGFHLSDAAAKEVARRKGIDLVEIKGFLFRKGTTDTVENIVSRNDPVLIAVVREMGEAAAGMGSKLCVVDVDCTVEVTDDDGYENVSVYGGIRT